MRHAVRRRADRSAVNSPRTLPARLSLEWTWLASQPAAIRRAGDWHLDVPFRTLDDVIVAAGFAGARGGVVAPCANDVLGRLLVTARADDLAARTVLQRVLPGLCNRARRWRRMHQGDWLAAFDDLVSAAWPVIRSFPVERRPAHLAANLLRDTEHLAYRKAARRVWVVETIEPRLLDVPEDPADPEPLVELVQVVELARGQLADDELRLVQLLLSGRPPASVAGELGVSERTVRNRRAALVTVLRDRLFADDVSVPVGTVAGAGCC